MLARSVFFIKQLSAKSSLLDKIFMVVTVAVIVCALGFFSYTLTGQAGLLIVKSGSMAPAMPAGSLIIFRPAGMDDILNGEIVVFKERQSNSIISHRAVEKAFADGKFHIKTKGDKNSRPDNDIVNADNLMGRAVLIIPQAGRVLAYTKTAPGMLILNFALAFLVMLIVIDRVRAKERMRAALAYGANAGEAALVNPAIQTEAALVNPSAIAEARTIECG